jgi:hypothetical protein
MRHHTKDKGDLAVARVIVDLARAGIRVCLPLSEHLPFDVLAVSPSRGALRRVQVKCATANKRGAAELKLRRTHADRRGTHSTHIRLDETDAFAVFSPETDTVYYVRRDEIPAEVCSVFVLRLTPAKNRQTARTRLASDFEGPRRIFGPVAQWIEPAASNRLVGGSIPSGPATVTTDTASAPRVTPRDNPTLRRPPPPPSRASAP